MCLNVLWIINLSKSIPHLHRCHYDERKPVKIAMPTFKSFDEELDIFNEPFFNSSYGPIRILMDYSNCNVTNEVFTKISEDLMSEVVNIMNKYFEINRTITRLLFSEDICYLAKVPLEHQTVGIRNVDLVLYISASNDQSDTSVAWAAPCFLDDSTYRPIAAQVNLNLYYLNNETYSTIQSTILHELFHVLGFDYDFYGVFRFPNGSSISEDEVFQEADPNNLIVIPEVVSLAKNYFDCEEMEGVPLEKGLGVGSDDSHWAQEYFSQEIMSPVQGLNVIISNFTLAFFNNTGWYRMNYNNKSSLMNWGKKKGCSFIYSQCYGQKGIFGEYCSVLSEKGCTPDNRFISLCWNSFSETHCPINYASKFCSIQGDLDFNLTDYEYFGFIQQSGSKCFISDISKTSFYDAYANSNNDRGSKCLQADCVINDNGEKNINISFVNYTLVCNKSNVWISPDEDSGYSGIFYCPDIESFCQIYPQDCLRGCNGNGACVQEMCECLDFITGEDCNDMGEKFLFNGTGLTNSSNNYNSQYYS